MREWGDGGCSEFAATAKAVDYFYKESAVNQSVLSGWWKLIAGWCLSVCLFWCCCRRRRSGALPASHVFINGASVSSVVVVVISVVGCSPIPSFAVAATAAPLVLPATQSLSAYYCAQSTFCCCCSCFCSPSPVAGCSVAESVKWKCESVCKAFDCVLIGTAVGTFGELYIHIQVRDIEQQSSLVAVVCANCHHCRHRLARQRQQMQQFCCVQKWRFFS